MLNILFVCSANRFRSVIAAGCLESIVHEHNIPGDWKISSAGIWAREGAPPLREAIQFGNTMGFDLESIRSREITAAIVASADLIIVMTQGQKEAIANEFLDASGKLVLLSEICTGQFYDIPDPVVTTDEDPDLIANEICVLLKKGLPNILAHMGVEHSGYKPVQSSSSGVQLEEIATLPEKKPKRRWWIWLLLLLVAVIAASGYYLWTNPIFGKQLPEFSGEMIQTFTPLPAVQTALSGTVVSPTQQTPVSGHGKESEEVRVKKSDAVCGQTEPMIVLALGIDEVEQADVIRLVRVDFVERKVLVLSIPRDFWVPIPGLEEYDISQFRINAAYGYGEYFNGAGQGVVKFSETVYYNYGIIFDQYGAVNFDVFEELIDAVGGVDFYLDGPIGAYGYKGYHHMDGATALEFARERKYDLDAYRIQRQSVIIDAFIEKVKQPENLTKLPALGMQMLQDDQVVTDFTLRDIYTFICFIQEIDKDSIIFMDMPLETYTPMITNYGRHIKVPKPEATTYIQDLILNGNY